MLWLQVRSAAEEYHAEFAAKEATIATLTAEAESARSHMQAEIDRLRSDNSPAKEQGRDCAVSVSCVVAIMTHLPF